jgi:hypothetical protein
LKCARGYGISEKPPRGASRLYSRSNEKNETKVFVEHTINQQIFKLPLEQESQGTKQYYNFAGALAWAIAESRGVVIDEIESSLHPDLYQHFLLMFLVNARQSQLIATTHNRELLLNKDMLRRDAIWFTDKTADGAAELYSLADFDTKVIRDTSSIYNAYKTGKVGGVPHLGDYYLEVEHEEK